MRVSVWVGFDRGIGMRDKSKQGVTGARGAAPIWADFMIQATDGEPSRDFTIPFGIQFENVNPVTGSVAGSWTAHPLRVALRSGHALSNALENSTIIEEDLAPQR